MSIARNLVGAGISSVAAQAISGTVAINLTATGTTRADALQLSTNLSVFSTVASGTGCIIFQGDPGDKYEVVNGGANALSVYPPAGGTIAGGSVNAPYSLAAGTGIEFMMQTNLTVIKSPGSQDSSGGGTTFSALTYSTTGTLWQEPIITLSTPSPSQIDGVVGGYSGKWADTIGLTVVNTLLTSISFTDLEGITNALTITAPNLTSIAFPALKVLTGNATMTSTGTVATTTLDFSALEYTTTFQPASGLTALSTLSHGNLKKTGGNYSISSTALTSIVANNFISSGGNYNIATNTLLTTLSATSLVSIATLLGVTGNSALAAISFPALKYVGGSATGGITISTDAALTSVSFPVIERLSPNATSSNVIAIANSTAALATISLGTSLKQVGGTAGSVVISSAALTQASVDHILHELARLDGTAGTTAFSSRTVTITGTSSTPSAAGLADKAILVARGCTVTNN